MLALKGSGYVPEAPVLEAFWVRDSNTGVFLWNFRNFWKHLFWRTSANDCFWRRLGVKKIFNFPMFHIDSQFSHSRNSRNFESSLSNKIWRKYAYPICFNSPFFGRQLPPSLWFLKSPVLRWSWLEYQMFMNFSSIMLFINLMWKSWLLLTTLGTWIFLGHYLYHEQ